MRSGSYNRRFSALEFTDGAWVSLGGVWGRADNRDRLASDAARVADWSETLECPRNADLAPGVRLVDAATSDRFKIVKVEDADARRLRMRIELAADDRLSCAYARGAASVTLLVTPSLAEAKALDESGALVDVQVSEFLIRVSDLVLSGVQSEPKRGDTLTVTEPDGTNTYTLIGEEAFSFTDARRRVYRVRGSLTARASTKFYLVDPDGIALVDPDGRRLVA